MSAKFFYTEGPFDKPCATHLVSILRPADTRDFYVVALPDGTQHVAHRSKLAPVAVEQAQAEGGA